MPPKILKVVDQVSEMKGTLTLQITPTTSVKFIHEQVTKKRVRQTSKQLKPFYICKGTQRLNDTQFVLSAFTQDELDKPMLLLNMVLATNVTSSKVHTVADVKSHASHTGWGHKPGSSTSASVKTNWAERWFAIRDNSLEYFADEEKGFKGSFSLHKTLVTVVDVTKTKRPYCLCIKTNIDTTKNTYYYLQFGSPEEVDEWVIRLKRAGGITQGANEAETVRILYENYKASLCSFGVYTQRGEKEFAEGVLLLDIYNNGTMRYLEKGKLLWTRPLYKMEDAQASNGAALEVRNSAGRLCVFYTFELFIKNTYPKKPTTYTFLMGERQSLFMESIFLKAKAGSKEFIAQAPHKPIVTEQWAMVGRHDAEDHNDAERYDKCFLVLTLTNLMLVPEDTSVLPIWSFMLHDVSCTAVEEKELIVHTVYKAVALKFYGKPSRDAVLTGIADGHQIMTQLSVQRGVKDVPAPQYFLPEEDSDEEQKVVVAAKTKKKKKRKKKKAPPPPPPEDGDEEPPPPPPPMEEEEPPPPPPPVDLGPPPATLAPFMPSSAPPSLPSAPPPTVPLMPSSPPPALPSSGPPPRIPTKSAPPPVPGKSAPPPVPGKKKKKPSVYSDVTTGSFSTQRRRRRRGSDDTDSD